MLDHFLAPNRTTLTFDLHEVAGKVPSFPSAALDFILFATAVFAADKKVLRSETADRWTRSIDLSVPVVEPDQWSSAEPYLRQALSYLTGDEWRLSWRPSSVRIATAAPAQHASFDSVTLFSGGLDSLAGAIDLLEGSGRVLLVGHRDSPQTPEFQRRLAAELTKEYGEARVQLVRARAEPTGKRMHQAFPLPSPVERTTRSRSMIFIAVGLAATAALGLDTLRVPENGFIALNIPLTMAHLGSCSTRTTHPFFFQQLSVALRQLGLPQNIVNPFEYRTKGEVLRDSSNGSLLRRLADYSVSCARPAQARYDHRPPGNCGYCFPCIIRRASLHVVDADHPGSYLRDVRNGIWLRTACSVRTREARAVFARLRRGDFSEIDLLQSGPLARERIAIYQRLANAGLKELRDFFRSGADDELRRISGL